MRKITLVQQNNSRFRDKLSNNHYLPLSAHRRKDSAQGYTNFETYPQNQFEGQQNSEMYYKEEGSVCPSIEQLQNLEEMEQFLEDLSKQLEIKTTALKKAQEYINLLQENLVQANNKIDSYVEKQTEWQNCLTELQAETNVLRSELKNEGTGKKSITKTIITDKKIPYQDSEPLKMISGQIFNQFSQSFSDLIHKLSVWVQKQQQEQNQQGGVSKVQNIQHQVEEMIFEFPQISSNLTNYNTIGSKSRKIVDILQQSYSIPIYSHEKTEPNERFQRINEEYQNIIRMYSDYSKKMYQMLCQCINSMANMTDIQGQSSSYHMPDIPPYSPRTVVPPQLFNVIVREVCQIYSRNNKSLRRENKELKEILDSLILWLSKNVKNGQNFSFQNFQLSKIDTNR